MKQSLLIFCFSFLSLTCVFSTTDSLKICRFFAINTGHGGTFKNSDFLLDGGQKTPEYTSFSLKYGVDFKMHDWRNYYFGHPYIGIGIYTANFYHRQRDIGVPISVYFFQGANIFSFTPSTSLNYELNIGGSFNWKPNDPFTNPNNDIIGSSALVHFSVALYYKWKISQHIDINIGGNFSHFSNGGTHLPNHGMNMAGGFLEIAYHINRDKPFPQVKSPFETPTAKKSGESEIMFLVSSRNARVDTVGTGLSSRYTQQNFRVLGFSYSYLFSNSHRFKWGPSVEASYDESAGISSRRELNPNDGKYYDRVINGKFSEQISLGISMKGEMRMPFYALFANIGYDIIHANNGVKRLYQMIGFKVNVTPNLFGTFAIRTTNFSKVQYPFLNFGYTIPNRHSEKTSRKGQMATMFSGL